MSSSPKSTLPLPSTPRYTYNHTPQTITSLTTHLLTTHSIPFSLSPSSLLSSKSSTPHSPSPPSHHPLAILYPKTTAHVSAIASECFKRRIAIVCFAGGTGLGGALANVRGGVCVDFRDMNNVVRVGGKDEGDEMGMDMDVTVQPGVGWMELNDFLRERGVGGWLPVDPAPGAKVGGMIAMNASGTNAYRYGPMKQWVISLTLVLADGTIVKTRNRPRKSSAGYDLASLIVGSEGTLAIVTEAVLKLAPLPKNIHVGTVVFDSTRVAVDASVRIMRDVGGLEAVELLDRSSMAAINASGVSSLEWREAPTLFFKIAGPAPETVAQQAAAIERVCREYGCLGFEITADEARGAEIWNARKAVAVALVAMKKDESDLFLHADAAVPISKIAVLVGEMESLVAENKDRGWFGSCAGHVGDGALHTAIVCPKEDREEALGVLRKVQRRALQLEGTITGEHGVGLGLRDLLCEEVGVAGVDLMRKIKVSLDPRGILNPDKVVRLEADGVEDGVEGGKGGVCGCFKL